MAYFREAPKWYRANKKIRESGIKPGDFIKLHNDINMKNIIAEFIGQHPIDPKQVYARPLYSTVISVPSYVILGSATPVEIAKYRMKVLK